MYNLIYIYIYYTYIIRVNKYVHVRHTHTHKISFFAPRKLEGTIGPSAVRTTSLASAKTSPRWPLPWRAVATPWRWSGRPAVPAVMVQPSKA
jgi:hypothetical protein